MNIIKWSSLLDYKIEKTDSNTFMQYARKTSKIIGFKIVGPWYLVHEKKSIHEIIDGLTPNYLLFPIVIIEMYKTRSGKGKT